MMAYLDVLQEAAMMGAQRMEKGGKVKKVMREFKQGKLRSGSKTGPKVKNYKQAVAIALSEAGKKKMAKGGRIDGIARKGRTKCRIV
jgi:hypothetical protein